MQNSAKYFGLVVGPQAR